MWKNGGNLDILWLAPWAGQRQNYGQSQSCKLQRQPRFSSRRLPKKKETIWPIHELPPIMTRYADGPKNAAAFPLQLQLQSGAGNLESCALIFPDTAEK